MIESEIVAPGSLKAVLSGKHYNRCIRAHKLIYEAMERLRFRAFEKTLSTLEKGDGHTQLVLASKKTKIDNGLWKSTRMTESSILRCCTTSLSRKKVKKTPYLVQLHRDGTATATLYQSDKNIRLDITLKFTTFHDFLFFCYRSRKLFPLCTVLLA